MYQALYRKYRPLIFADVVGQEHIVETVKNQIVNNKISHAYMFTGTRGTGKTTCAKILSRAVNCENPKNGDPCNECETCKGILNGSLLDVIEIDAASNNGVDNIRELRDDVIFTPASAKYKVYIIDEVHMLSTQAFNALLKTLEEPPPHIIFVFATTEIHKVPQTILSRCQRFDFKRITLDDIKNRIDYVADKEGFVIEENAAYLIAKLADGAMRDALSVLDRCLGYSKITLDIVEQTVGICSYDEVAQALEAIAADDAEAILDFYNQCRHNSKDAVSLFSELCSYFRDMVVIKLTKNPDKFLNYDKDKLEKVSEVSKKFTLEKIIRCVSVLQNGIYDISKFKDRNIMAELTLIKLTTPKLGNDFEDLNSRLSRLEVLGVAPVTVKTAANTEKIKKEKVTQTKSVEPALNADSQDVVSRMLEILPLIGGRAIIPIISPNKIGISDDAIILYYSKGCFEYNMLSKSENIELIKQAALKATGQDYNVVFTDSENVNDSDIDSDDAFSEILIDANDILYEE